MRKLVKQRQLTNSDTGSQSSKGLFSEHPLTQLLQPNGEYLYGQRRFQIDKLDISDIPGVKPDTYGPLKHIEGRTDYMHTDGIAGAQPSPLKQNHRKNSPDFSLEVKDINPDKWQSKRTVNPLLPEYEVSTKSGRMMRIGHIEKSSPQQQVSVATRRIANYTEDIDKSHPKRLQAISDQQRQQIMSNNSNLPYSQNSLSNTRNAGGIFDNMSAPLKQPAA